MPWKTFLIVSALISSLFVSKVGAPPPQAKILGEQTSIVTPTPRSQPSYTSEDINNFINAYSDHYSVDPNVLRHMAICESGFNPQAKNWIYAGLFQFDKNTWISYRRKLGLNADPDLRYNAQEAVRTTAFALSLGARGLWPNCYPH